jgi:outer membrane protein assembly factor BamD (BamD/ComL family)
MSVLGIASSSLFGYLTQGVQGKKQQFQQEFQQLGQDLQAGNLTAAQSDIRAIQKNMPASDFNAASQSNSKIATDFRQLSTDLQSGNLSAAQSDYTTLQKDFQSVSTYGNNHRHANDGSRSSAIKELLNELGSALQSGNLTNAQQAYTSLQQDLLQVAQSSGPTSGGIASSSTSNISVRV